MPKVLYSGIPQARFSSLDPFVSWTDAIAPVIARSEISPKSHNRGLEVARHLKYVRIHAVDIVGRHQRNLVDERAAVVSSAKSRSRRVQAVDFAAL